MHTRNCILACLGRFPEKDHFTINEISSEDMGDHERKLISYTVEKCNEKIRGQNNDSIEKVQAYVLIPKNMDRKVPGVLAIHQHHSNWEIGKSEVVGLTSNHMYSYGLDLVRQGYVVIAPDLLCFESRMGNEEYRVNKEAHRSFERFQAIKYLTNGSTLQAKTVTDLSRAIDALCSFPFVDASRIGAVGHSLGGQEAIWISWYDERVKVAASSCGISCIKDFLANGYQMNSWLCIPDLLEYCDMDRMIHAIVQEKKLIMTTGLKDDRHCPLTGIDKIEKTVGNNPNFKLIRFDDAHVFRDTEKELVYAFLKENI